MLIVLFMTRHTLKNAAPTKYPSLLRSSPTSFKKSSISTEPSGSSSCSIQKLALILDVGQDNLFITCASLVCKHLASTYQNMLFRPPQKKFNHSYRKGILQNSLILMKNSTWLFPLMCMSILTDKSSDRLSQNLFEYLINIFCIKFTRLKIPGSTCSTGLIFR